MEKDNGNLNLEDMSPEAKRLYQEWRTNTTPKNDIKDFVYRYEHLFGRAEYDTIYEGCSEDLTNNILRQAYFRWLNVYEARELTNPLPSQEEIFQFLDRINDHITGPKSADTCYGKGTPLTDMQLLWALPLKGPIVDGE